MILFKLKILERSAWREKGKKNESWQLWNKIRDPDKNSFIISESRSRLEIQPRPSLGQISEARPLTHIFKHTIIRPYSKIIT